MSASGGRVNKWSATGARVWETVVSPSSTYPPVSSQLPEIRRIGGGTWSDGVGALVTTGETPALVVLCEDQLHRLDLQTGEVVWQSGVVSADKGDVDTLTFRGVTELGGYLYAIGAEADGVLVIASRDLAAGKAGETRRVVLGKSDIEGCRIVNGGRTAVCISGAKLHAVDTVDSDATVQTYDLPSGSYSFSALHDSAASRESSSVTVSRTDSGETTTFSVGSAGIAAGEAAASSVPACGVVTFEDSDIVVGARAEAGQFTVDFSLASGGTFAGVKDKLAFSYGDLHGRASLCSAHLFRRSSDNTIGYALVVSMEDDSILYVASLTVFL